MKYTILFLIAGIGLLLTNHAAGQLGERPAIATHVDQTDVETGDMAFDELFDLGQILFDARFNILDGQGRPGSTGGGAPREPNQPAFIRTSSPESNSCSGCHVQPRSGGAGDFVANVFVLAQTLDPVTDSVDGAFSNERNTLGMMGSGPIEMLSREMTSELIAIRESALLEAQQSGVSVRQLLVAKDVSFGAITVQPDGLIDPTEIEGVDWDLIIKPFHQKGAVVSLREFTNNAMNHHHGMQSVERFGEDVDADLDGVVNELTVGDMTAVTIYQAGLNTPGQMIPEQYQQEVAQGRVIFEQIGCADCHVPALTLENSVFTEPNPYNPPGNLTVAEVSELFSFDMVSVGPKPRLERSGTSGAIVRAFTDLKRHDLNDAELNHFANEQVPQGKLNGFAPESDFTIPAPTRSTTEFLSRKLWDVGNTDPYGHRGDLTTITQAIEFHGGEARTSRDAFMALSEHDQDQLIEFLKSLQVVEDGSELVEIVSEDANQGLPISGLCGAMDGMSLMMIFGLTFSLRYAPRRQRHS